MMIAAAAVVVTVRRISRLAWVDRVVGMLGGGRVGERRLVRDATSVGTMIV